MQIATSACLALVALLAEGGVEGKPSPAPSPPPTPVAPPTQPAHATTAAPVAHVAPPFAVCVEGPRRRLTGSSTSKVKVIDASKVYYGDAKTSQTPAVIDSQRVWDKIPEYQEIKKKGLTEADLEYWVLLKKASKKFNTAVSRAAQAKSHDLIAETGAVEVKGQTLPDVTDAVIAELP